MNDIKEEKKQDAGKSRRDFLKISGSTLAGLAMVGGFSKILERIGKNRFSGIAFAGEAPQYEVYALKYADLGGYPMYLWHWMGNPPLVPQQDVPTVGCYYWLIKGPDINILYDTGCNPETAEAHHLGNYENHSTMLGKLGLKTEDIGAVIISHSHWDHVNGVSNFQQRIIPFYIQEAAFRWSVEKYPKYPLLRKFGIPAWEDVQWLARLFYMEKLKLVTGKQAGDPIQVAPGVSVLRTDGHMMGHQVAIVQTAKGPVVLASDAAYLYSNLDLNWPVGLCMTDITDGMDAIRLCKEKAGKGGLVIPGHDPLVMKKFPEVKPGIFKIA